MEWSRVRGREGGVEWSEGKGMWSTEGGVHERNKKWNEVEDKWDLGKVRE